jgi:hypothetical protein
MINFQAVRGPDGKIRSGVWDRFCTWGAKTKEGLETVFDENTLPEMVRNWKIRGDELAMDFNHQSAYTAENGQPAPALAWYSALAVFRNGVCICFERLDNSTAIEPPQGEMQDGLWGYRSEVTELGQELLPNFKYISPTFTPQGKDEQGNPIGYVIHAVAATNTPFQSGTSISFEKGDFRRREAMIFSEKLLAMLGLDAGADETAVQAAFAKKMEDAAKCMAEDEPDSMKKMADEMEQLAKHYEEAYEEGPEAGPHVAMKKLAARLGKMAAGDDKPEEKEEKKEEKEAMEKDDEAKMELTLRREYGALASRLGVNLPEGATSKQMFDAISAATVPAAQLPALVDARVKQVMMEKDQARLKEEAKIKAKALVDMAIAGGYPEEQRNALLNFASEPKSYAAAEAMVSSFIKVTENNSSLMFSKMTAAGAPLGVDPRKESPMGAKDRRVVRNELATFVIEGEKFSTMAKEWADSKEGPIKMEIDSMLSDSEQSHAGYRLIAANRLLKARRPDLWAAAEEQDA